MPRVTKVAALLEDEAHGDDFEDSFQSEDSSKYRLWEDNEVIAPSISLRVNIVEDAQEDGVEKDKQNNGELEEAPLYEPHDRRPESILHWEDVTRVEGEAEVFLMQVVSEEYFLLNFFWRGRGAQFVGASTVGGNWNSVRSWFLLAIFFK